MIDEMPRPGHIVQVDITTKLQHLAACLLIVKKIDHERDEVVGAVIVPGKKRSETNWVRVPLMDTAVIGNALWAPTDITTS